jgi:hypothetical protein
MTLDELLKLKERQQSCRPYVVVHCGSTTRAREVFERERLQDTLRGHIVLTIGANKSDPDLRLSPDQALKLDLLHLWKIDLADIVRIFNVGGYIGESTARELAYAQKLGKRIDLLEYAPVQVPGVCCSDCWREEVLYPCVYCGVLVCRECSFDTDEWDLEHMRIPLGEWMCISCGCK